ncbi:cyclopropane-fatty-acyl-phospholipid synthase family protein [Sorangium sp. So ce315]|uniref:class I SAM-dependent methyltransferase n=1 Tax=Sorangium sp. So ce315 TaxID=3133299 RepID=UPI003F5F2EA1
MLLVKILNMLIDEGALTLIDACGVAHRFARCADDSGEIVVRLSDRRLHWKLLLNPGLSLGEAYTDGTLTVERGSVYDLLDLGARNVALMKPLQAARLGRILGRSRTFLQQYNPPVRARRNVAHHYDLPDTLFDHFLDPDRQYSCAYFADPHMTLEEAQEAKKRQLATKLLLRPGQRVLDIGSGWGGLCMHLARVADVDVTGITLSARQVAAARRRAAEAGLEGRVRFHLCDYRSEVGEYDRIVSVGMFEHVGAPHYDSFFRKVRDLLADDGVAVLHAIGRMDGSSNMAPWLQKHIFPGAHLPALSEVLPSIERAGLWVTDLEILRLHYAETLRHWRRRFLANAEAVARTHGARFRRMWEFYLASSEVGFRRCGLMVFQVQLAKRVDAVPLTRDYLFEAARSPGARLERAA